VRLKEETEPDTISVGDLNTPLSSINRLSRQKICKDTLKQKKTLDKMDITDIYRIFHPMTTDYTFFSSAGGTFSKIDHILGNKANLNKYKKI
jgi:exonuclease III